jgi:hypothetical protein
MFDIKKYDYDRSAAETGAKMIVGTEAEDYILIARIPNKAYRAELNKTMQAHGKVLEFLKAQSEEKHSEKDRELQAGVLAKTVVLGWEKVLVRMVKKLPTLLRNVPVFL